MPVVFTFDIDTDSVQDTNDRTRIQVNFHRLGWEHLGGSSWRYPKLGADHASEDWFNHVVPALMYFRSIVEHSGMVVTKFTLDAHSEAGYRGGAQNAAGPALETSANITMYPPNLRQDHEDKLSEARLRRFFSEAAGSL